jgi:hypothetical protein
VVPTLNLFRSCGQLNCRESFGCLKFHSLPSDQPGNYFPPPQGLKGESSELVSDRIAWFAIAVPDEWLVIGRLMAVRAKRVVLKAAYCILGLVEGSVAPLLQNYTSGIGVAGER